MSSPSHRQPIFDTSVPVLVLRRSLTAFQHGALGIARSLGRPGVPVRSVRTSPWEPATRSRYLTDGLALAADEPVEAWVQALLALKSELRGAILLPIDDLAAVAVGDHRERLAEVFRLPAAPPGIERRLASKRDLWRLCGELGLPAPHSIFPRDGSEVLGAAESLGFPVVLKRAETWFAPRDPDAPSVAIVHDRAQLMRAYARMESDEHPQVMIQEHIPGGSETVWMFNGYMGSGGECLCAFTGRKLRQSGKRTGPTTLGICEPNPEVVRLAERLLTGVDYRGIVDMGFRYDARDARYKLLDVNPRLGSTFRLFVSGDGIDVVRALHLDLTGRLVPRATTVPGRKWVDERGDLITALRMARAGELGPRDWVRPLRGVSEGAWWAADDPWPFVGMTAAMVPHALRRLGGRRRTAGARA